MMPKANYTFQAMGTAWEIETTEPLAKDTQSNIHHFFEDYTAYYSRFEPTSTVSQLANGLITAADFPESIIPLIDTYQKLATVSEGKINPFVGKSLEQLGYDATYSLTPKGSPAPSPSFEKIFTLSNTALSLKSPALLDIGAVGKGYAVDKIARIINGEHVIDGSGDISVQSASPERIGLEHPIDPTKVIGVVSLTNHSLCASATNRRKWSENLHHILDATTGKPLDTDIIATWAVVEHTHDRPYPTMIADALTTGLFFYQPEQLAAEFGTFLYAIMRKDNTVTHNIPQSEGEIFS